MGCTVGYGWRRFNPQEPEAEDLLMLHGVEEDRALDTLLGTADGINHLAEFLDVSGAFAKEAFA